MPSHPPITSDTNVRVDAKKAYRDSRAYGVLAAQAATWRAVCARRHHAITGDTAEQIAVGAMALYVEFEAEYQKRIEEMREKHNASRSPR